MLARALDDLLPTGGHVLADPDDTVRWLADTAPSWHERRRGVFDLG